MSANKIYKQMIATASTLSVDELKKQIIIFMDCDPEYAAEVFSVMLAALESKLSEKDFIEFCDAI